MKNIGFVTAISTFFSIFFFTAAVMAGPPGLSKGHTPHGLQGKTPAGWSKGKKKGWYKTHPVKSDKPHIWKFSDFWNDF